MQKTFFYRAIFPNGNKKEQFSTQFPVEPFKMKTPIENYVIEQVRRIRREQKVSQDLLAYGIGVTKGFIGQAESPKFPTKYNLNHLNEAAKFLNCNITDFFPKQPL